MQHRPAKVAVFMQPADTQVAPSVHNVRSPHFDGTFLISCHSQWLYATLGRATAASFWGNIVLTSRADVGDSNGSCRVISHFTEAMRTVG